MYFSLRLFPKFVNYYLDSELSTWEDCFQVENFKSFRYIGGVYAQPFYLDDNEFVIFSLKWS